MHRMVEAMRFAYAARANLGDPRWVRDNNVLEYEKHLLDEKYARQIRSCISDGHTLPVYAYNSSATAFAPPDSHGTSHIVAVDSNGLAVTMTTTVNLLFGAQMMEPSTGIVLNNQMNDFSIPDVPNAFGIPPSEANFIHPFKRPLSSSSPVIVSHGDNSELLAAIGATGGSRIISATIFALWNLLALNTTMTEAVGEPRSHDQLVPNTIVLEPNFDRNTAASLANKGHSITWLTSMLSAVHGIRRLGPNSWEPVADPHQRNSLGLAT